MSLKVAKVINYWSKKSLILPNVFRLVSILDDAQHLFEHQDLSHKEILLQGHGAKDGSFFQMRGQFHFESLHTSLISTASKQIKKAVLRSSEIYQKTNTLLRGD